MSTLAPGPWRRYCFRCAFAGLALALAGPASFYAMEGTKE